MVIQEHDQVSVNGSENSLDSADEEEELEEEWGGISAITENEEKIEPVEKPISQAYVPPHLRRSIQPNETEDIDPKLRRSIKGDLNRISPQNISVIVESIASQYNSGAYPRAIITMVVGDTLLDIEKGILVQESMGRFADTALISYATLIGGLSILIPGDGNDLIAAILTRLIQAYDASLQNKSLEVQQLRCINLVRFIAHLYNCGVISCVLVYDFVRGFLGESEHAISDIDVELLLNILSSMLRSMTYSLR